MFSLRVWLVLWFRGKFLCAGYGCRIFARSNILLLRLRWLLKWLLCCTLRLAALDFESRNNRFCQASWTFLPPLRVFLLPKYIYIYIYILLVWVSVILSSFLWNTHSLPPRHIHGVMLRSESSCLFGGCWRILVLYDCIIRAVCK